MTAEIFAFLGTRAGREAIDRGISDALDRHLGNDLTVGLLGGTRLAYRVVSVYRVELETHLHIVGYASSSTPDPEGGKYDYELIAKEKEEYSVASGLSTREGLQRKAPGHYQWYGNVVVYLGSDPNYQLIVSCSGLSDNGDEMYAGQIASCIMRRVMLAYACAVRAAVL